MMLGDVKRVTVRKERRCTWCGEAVEVGQQARVWAWVDQRKVETVSVHPECYEAWSRDDFEEVSPYSNERPERPSGTAQEGKEAP